MKAGITVFFQHPSYLEEDGEPIGIPDHEVYRRDLAIATQTEAMGYDALWTVEHHFTGYTMIPDPTQLLAFIAGQTKRINVGTGAIIVPWHNPVRVTESIALLDTISNGRMILGLGRGLGRIEFEGLGVPMDEARGRFIEGAQMILAGLENGYVEFDGEYVKQPKRYIRPQPSKSFKNRTYAAAVSPESQEIMANLGIGILISPQKAWDQTHTEHLGYREMFERINGRPAPAPIVTCQVFVDDDPARANELGRKYLGDYYRTAAKHYEMKKKDLGETKGYEYYSRISKAYEKRGDESIAEHYANLQVFGTPDECLGKIEQMRDLIGCDHFNAIFTYAGIGEEEAQRNMQLWTDKVRPRLQAMEKSEYARSVEAA